MDSKIRARFYQVDNVQVGDAMLNDALTSLWQMPNRETYEDIFGGIRLRLERFDNNRNTAGNGFIDGELVRQQTENIPPIAPQSAPLEGQNLPLGHRCAFRYHLATRVVLLESRPNGVTPIRLDGLVKARLAPHRGYFLSPVITEAALQRLRNGTPRRVKFRVARPAEMAVVEGDQRNIEDNLARMANNFGGLTVETSVGFPRGDREGILSMNSINDLITWAGGNRDHVEKVEVKISEEPEPIDVFSEQMKVSSVLNLENLDVDANYIERQNLLRTSFNAHLPTIQRLYQQ